MMKINYELLKWREIIIYLLPESYDSYFQSKKFTLK